MILPCTRLCASWRDCSRTSRAKVTSRQRDGCARNLSHRRPIQTSSQPGFLSRWREWEIRSRLASIRSRLAFFSSALRSRALRERTTRFLVRCRRSLSVVGGSRSAITRWRQCRGGRLSSHETIGGREKPVLIATSGQLPMRSRYQRVMRFGFSASD